MAAKQAKKSFTIDVTPNYENTSEWFARALSQHAFKYGALDPAISLMEQAVYLYATDRPAYDRVMDRLRRSAEAQR